MKIQKQKNMAQKKPAFVRKAGPPDTRKNLRVSILIFVVLGSVLVVSVLNNFEPKNYLGQLGGTRSVSSGDDIQKMKLDRDYRELYMKMISSMLNNKGEEIDQNLFNQMQQIINTPVSSRAQNYSSDPEYLRLMSSLNALQNRYSGASINSSYYQDAMLQLLSRLNVSSSSSRVAASSEKAVSSVISSAGLSPGEQQEILMQILFLLMKMNEKFSSSESLSPLPSSVSSAEKKLTYEDFASRRARYAANPDINPNDWFAPAVAYIQYLGLMKGQSNGMFAPSKTLNQAELAAVLANAMTKKEGAKSSAAAVQNFPGWPAWALAKVTELKSHRVNTGFFTANPATPVTRLQAARAISETLLRDLTIDPLTAKTFADTRRLPREIQSYVSLVSSYGIMTGKSSDIFDPYGYLTRAEAAKIFGKAMDAE
ncbi:hypothetical protein A3C52_02350 [Candidatus Peribacteria bacterium RIFCSPHIGHO2_02_FULL_51_15]|nr:MAG: hypothetical protein A3C52_02350 [Candidatus Peribacteria bacterium RIFCSPHIGHO2_02_FULL_51_15]